MRAGATSPLPSPARQKTSTRHPSSSRPRPALKPSLSSPSLLQASWPKLGLDLLPSLLAAGANDMGGVLMKESITTAAGGRHGRSVGVDDLVAAATAAGRVVRQRTTLYGEVGVGVAV